jgi:ATP-dependent exoDNAse (exonuclease V) beta subunit
LLGTGTNINTRHSQETTTTDHGHITWTIKKYQALQLFYLRLSLKESRDTLQRWRDRIGEIAARKITTEAANRGTEMHYVLEQYINGVGYLNLSGEGAHARLMAHKIIENLEPLNIIYGSEVYLHYKDLYAGATDLVGVHDGKPAIIDFKQANKLKVREYIEDYYFQIAAYALAHEWAYGPIEKGCICICTKNFEYQQFTLGKDELDHYKEGWVNKVEQFNRAML